MIPNRAFRDGKHARLLSRVAWLPALSIALPGIPTPVLAQVTGDQDTRLRLEQQADQQRRGNESRLLEEADDFGNPPASIEIDGEVYSVGKTVSEMGKAIYILIGRRRWPEVQRFLPAYERLAGHDPMLVLYAKGGLARARGDLGAAERYYRALLDLQSNFLPGQLELARVLFENRKGREAGRAFEAARAQLVSEGDKAKDVAHTIDTFLAALKRRRAWQGSIAIGPSYSTNLNQSSASYTCLLAAPDGRCLIDRKVPDPIEAAGINFEAMLGRDVPLAGHHGVRARALLFGDLYPDHHAYSQATLIARLGYQYQTAKNAIALSPTLEIGTLGSSVLYQAWGANAEWTRAVSNRALLRFEGNYRDYRYRLKAFDAPDGALTDVSLTGWYSLSPRWTLFGGPDLAAKDARNPVDAYLQWGGRLGLSTTLGKSVSLLLLGSYRNRQYSAFSELLGAKRREDQFNATAIARFPALQFARLVPELVAQHTRVESNIGWLYSYKRTTASMRLSYAF